MTDVSQSSVAPVRRLGRWLDIATTILILVAAGAVAWNPIAARLRNRRLSEVTVPLTPVPLQGAHLIGDTSAQVVMIVFSDFECPFCRKFALEIWPDLKAQYIDKGLVRFAFLHYPLTAVHKRANAAAIAANCAGDQGQFWQMHDELFLRSPLLTAEAIEKDATVAALDLPSFRACIQTGRLDRIEQDSGLGRSLGVRGTPAFFFGVERTVGLVTVTEIMSGAGLTQDFSQRINRLLLSAR